MLADCYPYRMDLCASWGSSIVRLDQGFLGCPLLLLNDFFFHIIRIIIHTHFVTTFDALYQEGCSMSNVLFVVKTRSEVSESLAYVAHLLR